MKRLKKILGNPRLLFLLYFIALFFIMGYHRILLEPPHEPHFWRQTDCLSMTREFVNNGFDFFQPEIAHQLADNGTSGKVASEFPVIYYAMAGVWSVTGENFFVFRLLGLILVFFGLYSLFRISLSLFKSRFWALAFASLVGVSPIYVIYSVSFLSDMYAMNMVFIAWYLIFRYFFSGREWGLYAGIALFMLAGLIKVSSLISLGIILVLVLAEALKIKLLPERTLFRKPLKTMLILFVSLIPVIIWYTYSIQYNRTHGSAYYLQGIYPLWEASSRELDALLSALRDPMLSQWYSASILFVMLFASLYNFIAYRRVPRVLYIAHAACVAGCAAYFVLFGQAMNIHDYYFTPLLILTPVVFGTAFYTLSSRYSGFLHSRHMKLLFALLISYNLAYTSSLTYLRVFSSHGVFPLVKTQQQVNLYKTFNKAYRENLLPYFDLELYNRSIGIKPEDKVISLSDFSMCGTLYAMNQKGWTNPDLMMDSVQMRELIRKGGKYLFFHDTLHFSRRKIEYFLKYPIGSFQRIQIYNLQPYL